MLNSRSANGYCANVKNMESVLKNMWTKSSMRNIYKLIAAKYYKTSSSYQTREALDTQLLFHLDIFCVIAFHLGMVKLPVLRWVTCILSLVARQQ